MEALAGKIQDRLGWPTLMPKYLDKVDLEKFLPPLSFKEPGLGTRG